MKKFIISASIILIAFSACKKSFLKEDIYSVYSPETLTDSLGFEASIAGLQNQLSLFFTWSDQQGWLSVWQAGTDITYVPPTQRQGIEVPYYDYTQLTSTDGAALFTWRWAYQMINNANVIISNVENAAITAMSQANKDYINGEARFFRAYAYNILVTCFGRVPIITTPLKEPKTNFTRAPLDSANNLIVEDLTFGATKLPDIENVKTNSKGRTYARPNKYMAMQLLAEVYLRMNKPDLAETQAQAVINSNRFKLITTRYGIKATQPGDYYSDMFWYGNQRRSQGNTEAIWVLEMENTSVVPGGYTGAPQQRRQWGAAYYQIPGMKITDSLGGRGIARLRLNNWVAYSLFEANDIRNSHYNLRRMYWYNTPGTANFGKPVVPGTDPLDTLIRIAPHITKWYQYDPNDEFGFAMVKDIILMRLGETYLLLAEAQFKQNKLAQAAESLNAIRRRANATPVSAAQVTMDFILDERVRELIGEENRRMTLMRTGTLVDRATRLNGDKINGISTKNLLLPIPRSEIDLNKDAPLEQNPGY
ncbi:MAG: RagB/SusD family nutrient uptake outer membrane protein [Flavisolibacter sp.]|nr:RagB/SusD family nutrient uptake outer membrane protein [Flavisolibacter sp.]